MNPFRRIHEGLRAGAVNMISDQIVGVVYEAEPAVDEGASPGKRLDLFRAALVEAAHERDRSMPRAQARSIVML